MSSFLGGLYKPSARLAISAAFPQSAHIHNATP